jgi:hypothetical protein
MADLPETRLRLARLDATARGNFLPLICDHSSRGKKAAARRLRATPASPVGSGLPIAIEAAKGAVRNAKGTVS